VFLVLARKAPSIREPDLLSYWLHGVAFHTARKARGRLVRQRKIEQNSPMKPLGPGIGLSVTPEPVAQPIEQALLDREQAEALHYEIERLPQPFRLPVVLCYFEGLTLDEAARRLQWPPGTLRSRLARARDKLRRGLTRRGVVLSSIDLAVALRPKSALTCISSHLCDTTTKAAIQFTTAQAIDNAITISAATLAQEILRSTLINRMRLILLRLLVLSSAVMGAGYLTYSLAQKDEPRKLQISQQRTPTKADAPTRATSGRMFVVGRVLDPHGLRTTHESI
jgi:RNA polymerase sigma factor (sigma-70 family)